MLKGLTLRKIVQATGGKYFGSETGLGKAVSSVETDSRKCGENSLFIAIKGERVDGHDYAKNVIDAGAACVIAERPIDAASYILVENSVTALQQIAAYYRQSLDVKIVGITGSVGKTTCKEVIASVLAQKYNVLKTKGNFNNEIGLPLTLLTMTDETEVAVIEMGMSNFGEMALLSSIARPDLCVITNIGHSHMENLGSQEGILKAKSEIFEYMHPDAHAFVNGDDLLLRTISRKNIHYFGKSSDFTYCKNDIFVTNLQLKGFEGSAGTVEACGKELNYEISIPGEHVTYAVSAAIGVGLYMGLSEEQILSGLSSASTIDGRVNIIEKGSIKLIDDCYNAAPASMKAGIELLTQNGGENTVAILGDMGELGETAPQLHREVGTFAALRNVELTICIGELSKNIYEGCKEAGGNAIHFNTKEDFLSDFNNINFKNDTVILVKASHFMNFSEIINFICIKM